jgi:hypothetical protein
MWLDKTPTKTEVFYITDYEDEIFIMIVIIKVTLGGSVTELLPTHFVH